MRPGVFGLIGLALLAPAALAQEEKAWDDAKPAWRWTLEERMAKRFDPAEVEARAKKAASLPRMELIAGEPVPEPGTGSDSPLNGTLNPELYTPGELYRTLIELTYPLPGDGPSVWREPIEEQAASLGFGSDLWWRLRRASDEYLALRLEDFRGAMAQKAAHGPVPGDELCRARFEGLQAAYREFGRAKFLQLLYFSIATVSHASIAERDNLLRLEGGCQ
ncbi:MAG TPA: hypothetical protein DD490_30165 [Acidobacteria bacterium]|nr:hypothetical protein [Acidobacteriota bacterium]